LKTLPPSNSAILARSTWYLKGFVIKASALLPQNKMLPERIVAEGAFGKGFEDSIKFILDGLS
jgi:hypothetical protein